MTRSFKPLSASFLLLLLVSTALSQQQSGPTSEKELKRQSQRLQAISMVEQTAAEAPLWDNKKAAVQVLADAADLLWDETPGQGTKWLRKAWDLIDQVSELPKDEKLKEFVTRSDRTDLRTVVLSVARRHDAELADKLLKALSQKQPDEKKDRGAFDDRSERSEQLLQLAQQAVEANPDLAFSLAERSLADGLSYSLQNVLTSLRKKNVDLANRLFDLALTRFGTGQPDPSEGEVLAGYLFKPGFTFSTNSNGQTILAVSPNQQNLPAVASSEPQRAGNFLIVVYEVLLTRPVSLDSPEDKQRAQRIVTLGNRISGLYRTFAPELAQSAQGFLAQLQRQLFPDGETGPFGGANRAAATTETTTKRLTKEEIYEKHLSELEDRADNENNPIARKLAYVEAALAARPEDYQRAKRVAEKIDDNNLRADAVSFVLYRAALFFADRGEIDKAIDIAPTISDVARRAVVKIAVAQRLLSSKKEKGEPGDVNFAQQRALDLLNDIDRDLKKGEPSANAAKILLGRTMVLAKLDTDQALASLVQTIQMINKLDRFDLRDGAAPDLGMGAFSASGATVARPKVGFDFRSSIDPLIVTDFEQVSAVAERFTAKELSGVARLEAATLFLSKIGYSTAKQSTAVVR
jgi:tetratricopeptide (TPR) repeat protein